MTEEDVVFLRQETPMSYERVRLFLENEIITPSDNEKYQYEKVGDFRLAVIKKLFPDLDVIGLLKHGKNLTIASLFEYLESDASPLCEYKEFIERYY